MLKQYRHYSVDLEEVEAAKMESGNKLTLFFKSGRQLLIEGANEIAPIFDDIPQANTVIGSSK